MHACLECCPVQDVSSVSGGGYVASSLVALQHAWDESLGDNVPLNEKTGKVVVPNEVVFSYLQAIHHNVGIFVEGWSCQFLLDVAVLLWTVVKLVALILLSRECIGCSLASRAEAHSQTDPLRCAVCCVTQTCQSPGSTQTFTLSS